MEHVRFLPWVGEKYYDSRWGKRVMVLGDSHYCADPKEATSDLTKKVFDWLSDPQCEHEGWMNTYTKFARALGGKDEDRFSAKEVYDEVLFYNYVQEPLTGPREAPTKEMKVASEEPFMEVLEKYQPDVVFVWSKSRVYDHLPEGGRQGAAIGDVETWEYTLSDGHKVRVVPVNHPASSFAYDKWVPVINKALER